MNVPKLACMLALAVLAAACACVERSRALDDPAVPAMATAQQVCSNCHGVDGNSVSPDFPRLAAQQKAYLVEQLTTFRNHHRSDPAGFEYMWGLSRHLSDAQIEGLAAYFSSRAPSANVPGDPRLAARGKQVFERGVAESRVPPCHACHGEHAQGNGNFPRLAGQHADYIEKQLLVFQRTNQRPEGAVMEGVAHSLSRGDMVAVANYLQGLPPR